MKRNKCVMWIRTCCLMILVAGLEPRLGHADQLLVNAGFETGDFTGWTVYRPAPGPFGGTPIYGVATAGTPIPGTSFTGMNVIVHSGTYAGYAVVCQTHPCSGSGDVATDYLELSQTLRLVPGDSYTVGFDFGDPISTILNDGALIYVDGTAITLSSRPQLRQGFNLVQGTFIATDPDPTITFLIQGSGSGHAGLSFDDFFVNGPAAPAVPEPSSLVMLGTILLGLVKLVRR